MNGENQVPDEKIREQLEEIIEKKEEETEEKPEENKSLPILDWLFGTNEGPEDVRVRILYKEKHQFEEKTVPITQDTLEKDENKYNINNDKIVHNGGDLRLYYRAGNPEPLTWGRYSGEFSNRAMWEMEHDTTAIKGILSKFGVSGAGSLGGGQWAIILGAVGMMIMGFIYFYPRIMSLTGMG